MLGLGADVSTFAQRLLDVGAIPRKAALDPVHVAVAVVNGMDYLLTWNCAHIANAAVRVTRAVEGRQVYFQANRASPIFPELQQLLLKTAGAGEVIRKALGSLLDSIEVAFIYGSVAKGTVRAASDIDLPVVGRASFSEVVSALGQAQERLGRDINPTVYPVEEFTRKVRSGHYFLTTVRSEPKTFIIGSEHELGRLVEERLADRTPNKRARNRRPVGRRRA